MSSAALADGFSGKVFPYFKGELIKGPDVTADQEFQIFFLKSFQTLIQRFTNDVFTWVAGADTGQSILQGNLDEMHF